MKKAVILTRVSTKEQEEGHSLAAQNTRLIEYCKRKNLEVIKSFEIIESSTRGGRKKFREAIDFCLSQNETVALIADAVDRVQRSFKDSVLLDDLVRKEKIELHFYRENMVIGAGASASDIMRWDFSVMGAKSYVLQLSENVKRSLDYKLRNGERAGVAPVGYVNYKNEDGKNSIRPDEVDAPKVQRIFNLFALGGTSARELTRVADKIGLRSRMGRKLQVTGILSILRNPFYYGEMLAKGKLHVHVYQPLISKETFDACQRVLERSRCKPFKHGEKPFTYRGLIHCANTDKICPIDIKKQQFPYVVCWAADGQRRVYIPLKDIDEQICYILNSIEIPAGIIEQIRVHLAASKKQEVAFRNAETGRLKQELTRIENRIDALFNMRLDGEIDKETYNDKNDRLQLERHRVEEKLSAHKKADNSFNDTVLNLMEIARSSATIFKLSDNVEKKRLLLSFLFDRLELNEGRIGYKLRYPFNEFQNTAELCEPAENQGVAGENGRVLPFPENEAIEPKKDNKNKGLPEKTSLCSGWLGNLDSNQD